MRTIGSSPVGDIGYGCMGLSWAYTSGTGGEDARDVIHHALDNGVTMLDTSDFYGPHTNEELVGAAIRGRRDDVFVSTKGGLVQGGDFMRPNGRPEHIRSAAEGSLRRLGVDVIDLYHLHRIDPEVPLEETWGAMAALVDEGKVRGLGLCEVDVRQCEVAASVHPVTAVQSELSVWCKDALADVLPWCRENDAAFIAYSPLGRGFLTGAIDSSTTFGADDFRARIPRFTAEARRDNQRIVDTIAAIAERHGATPAQVALAWLLGLDDRVIPIPGTSKTRRLDENLAARAVALSTDEIRTLTAVRPPEQPRY